MPRTSRLIIAEQKAVYHVMSRTALDGQAFPNSCARSKSALPGSTIGVTTVEVIFGETVSKA